MSSPIIQQVQEFILNADSELRFETEPKGEKIFLTLKSGFAEIFGTELVLGKTYDFNPGATVAVFSWQGCVIELIGKTDVSYVARETPMVMYCNCHAALEIMRTEAESSDTKGPVTMIVGPSGVGKSTLCQILLNYAVRMSRRPILIDLDVQQGQISIPGSMGALLIERPAIIDEGFSQEAPLVYSFGHKNPSINSTLFNMIYTRLAQSVKEKMEINKKCKISGAIINTCGWIKGEGYKQLMEISKTFEVNLILVIDQERLFNELVRDMPASTKIVLLPKSGGVVDRSGHAKTEAQDLKIREYFYGTFRNIMYPHSFDIKWAEIKIFKIGAPLLPESCLPLGMKAKDHFTKIVALTPNPGMLHHLLAVSYAAKGTEEIIESHIAGFVCVTNIDMERQTLTLLSPQPKPLPNNLLILSDLQFMNNQ